MKSIIDIIILALAIFGAYNIKSIFINKEAQLQAKVDAYIVNFKSDVSGKILSVEDHLKAFIKAL